MKLLPEWINKKWREGSMGAADKKGEWAFCIVWSVIIIAILVTFTVVRGEGVSAISKFMSYVTCVGCIYAVWKYPDVADSRTAYWIYTLLGVALMIGFAIGFN